MFYLMHRKFEIPPSRLKSQISKIAYLLIRLTSKTKLGQTFLTLCTLFTINQTRTTLIRGHEICFSFVSDTWLPRRFTDVETLEPDTLTWIDRGHHGGILWDIGANVGGYSIYAAKSQKMNVFAFEPSPFNLEFLARNIWLNKLESQITVIPIALSEFTSQSPFVMKRIEWAGSGSSFSNFDDAPSNSENFNYVTIGIPADQVKNVFDVPQPDYIKLDVDGIEALILAGAAGVLSKVKSVLIEVQGSEAEKQKICDHLTMSGLQKERTARHNQIWSR